ncbi:MAG: carbonic anhydrase [Sulfuriflexus sp.]|nr:carbonic anhydrase [Sulfuriflexus sp.]
MQGNTFRSVVLLSGILLSSMTFAAGGKAHWGYDGDEGPSHWGDLSHDYATCKTGKSQSPINIDTTTTAKLANIKFNYQASAIDVVNNGHTIQVNYAKGSMLSVGGKSYTLLQFHFHSPSEHEVNGKPYDMVAHLVHQAADGQLGVIGVLMKIGKANSVIASVWDNMPTKSGGHNKVDATLNVAELLPSNHSYYNYSGSLTTPPCSEGVNWMVLQTPVEVSTEQVAAFTSIFSKSVRPVQPGNGRLIHANK